MLKISCQTLIHLKNFKLLTARHSSFYQLRISIFSQPTHSKKTSPLIPYLILNPQKTSPTNKQTKPNPNLTSAHNFNHKNTSSQQLMRKNSIDSKFSSGFQLQKGKNTSEIDSQTNCFLTKTFLARQVDQSISLDELVLFKGSFELSLDQLTSISQPDSIHPFNRIYVNCELFIVNSFSNESVGQWYGYTLADEGNVALPMRFFSYSSSFFQAQITFLWTAIQFTQESLTKQIPANQLNQLCQLLNQKYTHLSTKVLNVSKQPTTKHKQLSKDTKNTQTSLDSIKQTITQYNHQVYDLWKKFQQYHQQHLLSPKIQYAQNFINKLNLFQQHLAAYHWKNHIIVTQDNSSTPEFQQSPFSSQDQNLIKQSLKLEEQKNLQMPAQLAKLKTNPQIDTNLVFYPFENHQKMLKLQNNHFHKIAPISSLSQQLSLKPQTDKSQKLHLLVFVHGYQASSYDMQNLAAFFKYKQPQKIKILISTTNQGRTQQPMQESGHRLAIEIKNFINNKLEHQDFELSFVCHSMGGLITRAALKYLQLYKSKFKTFLSLCSPHLGYLYHTSTLVKTSLWVLNQVKKDPSMIQLTMEDQPELEKTFLYQLSLRQQLEWFKYPIFVGSYEDEYIPFWSALVQDKDFFFETKQAKVYKRLFKNITEKLEPLIIRLEAIYKVKINDISSFVGRTAHIRILNCIQVMEMIYLLTQKAF